MTKLEQLRLDAGLSVRDLATTAGVSHQTIYDLEALRARPHSATLTALATALTNELRRADPEAPAVKPSELLRDAFDSSPSSVPAGTGERG
jgi:transcriptional regulator with XRE-family HTH domain